ncbi:MAG: hypothetical protein ACOY3P_12295 [Planctomycetota bacterium]
MRTKSIVACWMLLAASLLNAAEPARRGAGSSPSGETGGGLLYYAKNDVGSAADNTAAIANPYITGALFQVIWSEVEKSDGQYDWAELDRWMKPWIDAKKKVAVRIMWSTSGNWPRPFYKTPTPRWVWQKGAKFAFHQPSGTEMPLIWDPIYCQYAWRFLKEFAARYDGHPALLFVDVTPGAETNPYRFGTINKRYPEFKNEFAKIRTSDGRSYSEDLWLETIKRWVDESDRTFEKAPLLVTLNVGGLDGPDRSAEIGDYCVARGFYVGQNGLAAGSYRSLAQGRAVAFVRWSKETKLFFEMAHGTRGSKGELMEVMKAAERIGCDYLNVYPEDVLRGTSGQRTYDPSYEEALKYGARVVRKQKG